jgi:hypothetical protein
MAQEPSYAVSLISPEMKAHADAVVRNEETDIDILKPGEVRITCSKVVTILDPAGKYNGAVRVDYNKSRPLLSVSAALYDATGMLVRKYKKADFEDVSSMQDFSLFEDNRERRLLPSFTSYPYTVKYAYTQKYKFTFYLPDWLPVSAYGLSLEHAILRVSAPSSIPLRYKGFHAGFPHTDSTKKGAKTFTWQLKDMKALGREPFSPPFFQSGIPVVIVSPARFEYYGMKGTFYTWKQYGSWCYKHLLQGRDKLPEATADVIRSLTAGLSTPREKARSIYAFAQQKNRYISIQIGKGGFEPMTASQVDDVSYGDCKALVNYMKALLETAGIPSYYTEVQAGEDPESLLPDFASAGQGNHVILCVPFGKDTTWLECTDSRIPFGYLGSFTDNRNVVIMTPSGGVLTRTPAYADSVNRQIRNASFAVDSAGNIQGKMQTVFEGIAYEKREGFEAYSAGRRIKEAKERYPLLQMNVTRYRLSFDKQALPRAWEQLSFSSPRYAAVSQNGLSFPLDPVSRYTSVPPVVNDRKTPFYIPRGYVTIDTLHYTFPATLRPSFLPRNVRIHTLFGEYQMQLIPGRGTLTCIRSLKIRSGTYPADKYAGFVTFLRQVSRQDQGKAVLTGP